MSPHDLLFLRVLRRWQVFFFIFYHSRAPPVWMELKKSIETEEKGMEKIHPKRRHDKDNPYTIWKEEDGSCHLSFFDGERKFHELEIPPQLYQLFDRFELEDLSHLNKVDRHWSEEELNGKLV